MLHSVCLNNQPPWLSGVLGASGVVTAVAANHHRGAVQTGPAVADPLDKLPDILQESHGHPVFRPDIEDGGIVIVRIQVQQRRLPGAAGPFDMDLIDQE